MGFLDFIRPRVKDELAPGTGRQQAAYQQLDHHPIADGVDGEHVAAATESFRQAEEERNGAPA